jgi:uncharacterized protein YndB with AHSA1/START domain
VTTTRIRRRVNAPPSKVYRALSPGDNEAGWRMSLARLAALVEIGL